MEKIVFMGTPDFASCTLKALTEGGFNVVGVLTQPDKPKGRGYALQMSPVKEYALSAGIPVYQPVTLKNGAFEEELKALDPDLIVVAAYGKILPSYVIDYPRLGCVNVHGSLLPEYRGAAPIQRALIDGKTETGVTIMQMDVGLDTGDMLVQTMTPITDADNFETLHDRMAQLGAETLLACLPAILRGELTPVKQDDSLSNYAAKIEKEDCVLDFSRPMRSVFNRIRGLSPFPLAFADLNGTIVKIPAAKPGKTVSPNALPGTVIGLSKSGIEVACPDGTILLTEVLPTGKKRMSAADFINGRKIALGDRFLPVKPE